MKEKAYITGTVLRWSRETAKFSIDDVARKLKCEKEVISSWEEEKEYPTLKQAEALSKLYRRPLAVFFLPSPPKDFQTLRDFRKFSEQTEYSTALTFIMRDIQSKQNWIKDLLLEEGESQLNFIGRFSSDSSVINIAKNIIDELEIQFIPNSNDYLNYWIEKVESKRIFVSLASNYHSHLPISIDEVRGFVISDSIAPFIFINTKDSKNAQLFTLVHELSHLWLDVSGISNINTVEFRESDKNNFDTVEILCNAITAEILMPNKMIAEYLSNQTNVEDFSIIKKMSKVFNVSTYAIIVRLLNLNYISKNFFLNAKMEFEQGYLNYVDKISAKKSVGGPDWYLLQTRKNSRAFTHYVYDFYKGGRITGLEASNYLNIKINNFPKLEKFLFA